MTRPFAWPPPWSWFPRVDLGGPSALPRYLARLAPLRDGETAARGEKYPVPFGWMFYLEPVRDAYALMPWWLYAVGWILTGRAWWEFCHLAVCVGFLRLDREGGYYRDGTWTWRWGSTIAWRFAPGRRYVPIPVRRWERLGLMLEGIINDFQAHDRARLG